MEDGMNSINDLIARLAITEEANSMLLARNKWLEYTLEVAGASPVEPSQAQPPAPGEAAREYMTGYSDCKEWAGATIQTLVDALKDATQSLETISMLAGRKTYGNPPIETFMETFSEVRGYAISRAGVGREAIAALRAQPSPLLQFCTCEDCKPMECEGCRINRERRELLLAPSDAAREYMNGYSDGREWAGAANQAQPSQAVEPTEAQLVTGVKAMRLFVKAMRLFVKAMRLFVTKNSIKDFRDGFIAAINAKGAAS